MEDLALNLKCECVLLNLSRERNMFQKKRNSMYKSRFKKNDGVCLNIYVQKPGNRGS